MPTYKTELAGTDKVLANLQKEISQLKVRSTKGMKKSLLLLRRRAGKLTPVSPGGGNLLSSMYTNTFMDFKGVTGEIGYTAKYAPYVHEMGELHGVSSSRSGGYAGQRINWTKPGTGSKFLERPLRDNAHQVVEILKREAKL